MKKISLYVLTFAFGLMACTNDKNEEITPDIVFSNTEFSVPGSGSTEVLSIKSNVQLNLESNQDWCTVTRKASESTAVLTYYLTTTANTTTTERSATITVTGNNYTSTVAIKQSLGDDLQILNDLATYTCNYIGGEFEVMLRSSGDYKVSISADWITQATQSESATNPKFYVGINAGAERTATITFTLGNLNEIFTVTQSAPNITSIGMESDATVIAGKLYAGWNIGNTLEAIGGETAWGNPKVTAELIKKVKDLGFNAIRIPCAWDQYIEDQSTYKLQDSWLERVSEVVNYCVINDVYAIVNIHWDNGWLENNCTTEKQVENNKKQRALWTQIANKLNSYDEHLLFAGCNEPNVDNTSQMSVLLSYEQTFIDAVRGTGGNNANRNLIIQGPSTDIDKTAQLFLTMPTDVVANRLMVEVHYYTPWTFCGLDKDTDWGEMDYFWGASNHVSGSDRNCDTKYEEEFVKSQFAKLKTQFVDKGIPVILGEYGATVRTGLGDLQQAHNKSRGDFCKVVTREAKNYGLVPFYWDGGSFAMIKRSTGIVNDKDVYDGIMAGAAEGKYPF